MGVRFRLRVPFPASLVFFCGGRGSVDTVSRSADADSGGDEGSIHCLLATPGVCSKAASSSRPRTRLPITPQILVQLRQVWELDKTLCCGKLAVLWSGEVTVPSAKGYDPLSHGSVALDCVPPQCALTSRSPRRTHSGKAFKYFWDGRTMR